MKCIDFYYDYGSPTAYLAWTQLVEADADKFQINYNPVLLGGIFAATNNRSPVHVEAKAKWMWGDLKMHAVKYNVEINVNDAFPVNTLHLMRGALFAKKKNILLEYNKAIFTAMWVDNVNLNEPKNIAELLKKNNFDTNEFFEATENIEIKEELKKLTSNAVEKGLFGVPSFIVDNTLYFGQDRVQWFLN